MLEEFREMLDDRDRENMPNVLFVAAECAPLSKTGGLADVVGTLPGALRPLGVDARVITPYHRVIKNKYADRVEHMFHFFVDLGWRHQYVGIEKLIMNDTVIYLVDSEMYFGGPIYRGGMAEIEQYAFFVRAVLEAMPRLDFVPEIVHCNDWHTAMIPMLARTQYRGRMQEKMKYLISIHNIAFQGWCSFDTCSDLLGVDPAYYTPEFIELNGCADFLKAGCVFSDRINTVSPTYAGEIKTAYYGEGLEGILNARSAQLWGILNGIDVQAFDPENEKDLPANFFVKDLSGKTVCKRALQEKMGLQQDPDVPVLSMVMRMTEQKGFELVMEQLDDIMCKEKLQFVLLGSGDARYEDFMRGAQARYPGRLGIYLGYNEELAHLIYAGSDLFLMPSRFEPCGLSQMIAMRYGCLPIVRETGGLKDSVIPYNRFTDEGDGFSFTNFDSGEMRMVISYAVNTYYDKKAYSGLVRRAMEKDFSFDRSAKEYVRLYIDMLDGYHETLPVLSHDCCNKKNRDPFGAVPCGSEVRLGFDVLTGKVKSADIILLGNVFENGRTEYPMKKLKNRFSVSVRTPEQPCALKYYFRVETKYGERFFCADRTGLSGALYGGEGEGFRLTVYRPDFETPEWFRRSVMYQIFPDRFGFYRKAAAKRGMEYHKSMGRDVVLHSDPSEPVKWESDGENEYIPNDFYGGTFAGISRKLPYLKKLGITCIYLNPICESASNHRYDTADYMNPDPVLGTEKDFTALCRKADSLGIKIILDGVFSHTGADSRYFNKYARYDDKGAYQSETSEYSSWYTFEEFPDKYNCWWDFVELPEVDERNPDWQRYIVSGEDSVIKTWMRRGASGWRIDVADEIPDDVLALIRKEVKAEDSDAPIIGEVWEDCVSKEGPEGPRDYALGNSLDSVMNYPFRFALIDYIMRRRNAWSFAEFLTSQQMNYPRPLYYSLMNLISSHDVDRIRTALASDVNLHDIPREELSEMVFDEERLEKALEFEKLAAVIQFVVPGVPCIYYGDEQGMTGPCDPLNRAPFREAESQELYDFYADLAAKRSSTEALLSGEAAFIAVSDDVLAILRYIPGGSAVCAVINRGEKTEKYSLNFSKEGFGRVSGKIAAQSAVILDL
ncbi:MAG: glycogen synthase GlgA [Eubacteriales bacterium]|nr:glycogen synthase GlgA [Eubacteriales bacterium]